MCKCVGDVFSPHFLTTNFPIAAKESAHLLSSHSDVSTGESRRGLGQICSLLFQSPDLSLTFFFLFLTCSHKRSKFLRSYLK